MPAVTSANDAARAVRKERAARFSVLASAGLALIKLAAGLFTGSLALLSDAAHALIDCGATLLTWFAVRESEKPADDRHHYGHGKIEALAALIETGFLFAVALVTAGAALWRLNQPLEPLRAVPVALAVLAVSVAVDVFRWRSLRRIADETGSPALAADAMHFSADLVSSVLVMAGLTAAYYGFPQGDALAALAVAVFIALAGWRLAGRTVDTLVDAAPEGAADQVKAIASGVRGVVSVERVRVRPAGNALFIDILIGVSRTLPIERIQAIKDVAAERTRSAYPAAEISITAEPRMLDNESVLERVLLIAAHRRTPVHHVTVQEVKGSLSIALDIELDGRMSLQSAHAIASKLEAAIRDEFGPAIEVETHIEPLQAQGLTGVDAPPDVVAAITRSIRELSAALPEVGRVHDVRVRETPLGQVVSLHVEAPPAISVEAAHRAVDRLEQAARQAFPRIMRIVTHAEPGQG